MERIDLPAPIEAVEKAIREFLEELNPSTTFTVDEETFPSGAHGRVIGFREKHPVIEIEASWGSVILIENGNSTRIKFNLYPPGIEKMAGESIGLYDFLKEQYYQEIISKMTELLKTKFKKQRIPKVKGGRPKFSEDIWAWEQVNLNGRLKDEVKVEWIEKAQGNYERDFVKTASLNRQYNKIIKPEWNKKG